MDNKQESEKISFFLFINSKSGGAKGGKYLTIPNRKLTYQFGKNAVVCLYFIDLFDGEERQNGLERMRKALAKVERRGKGRVSVVICGGDGTVLWVVSIIGQHGIDLQKISFCIIPIGTGNDFSRCLGWGGSPISFSSGNLQPLKTRLLEWLEAEQSWYDIWHSTVATYQDGEIIQIRDKQEVVTEMKVLERGFCNYFGVGIDARICYYVELKRQKNKWFNLALYGCVGLCKLFQRIRSTRDAVAVFQQGEEGGGENEREEEKKLDTTKEGPLLQEKGKRIHLKQGYGNLLALNSVRYMAGLRNVWNTNKLGIRSEPSVEFQDQRFDDGLIEFLGFKNQLQLGLERFGNFGARVAQGEGPYSIQFHRTTNNSSTYIHIDGQAMRLRQLKRITISKSTLAPNGRIRVLLKRKE